MNSLALSLCALLIIGSVSAKKTEPEQVGWDNTNSSHTYKYDPDILEDYKKVDEEIQDQWEELYNTVMAGYGYLKIEAEEELKKAVQWVKDFYDNTTDEYEQALYEFEQLYISTSDSANYEFMYDIEAIVYDNLDALDEATREAGEDLEEDYWKVVEALDAAQDDVEGILEIGESRVDDIMDVTEKDLETYINDLNEVKWDLQEVEYEVSEDIDDDFVDYYEEDEDDFQVQEYAAASELLNSISDVEDFDTAPSYHTEYEQKMLTVYDQTTSFMQKRRS